MESNGVERDEAPPADDEVSEAPDRTERGSLRIALWALAMLGLLGYLFLGQVGAVWWRYNPFTQRVTREVDQRRILEIWSSWLDELPQGASDWALSALFVGSAFVVLLTVIGGTWLLLISPNRLELRLRRLRDS
jgi:hypothetical protein